MGRASRGKRNRLTGQAAAVYDRLTAREQDLERRYPGAIAYMDESHSASAPTGVVPHPPEVWGPAAALAFAAVRGSRLPYERQLSQQEDEDAVLLAATAPWRFGRSIYLFDQTLASELWAGEPVDDLPSEVLYRLPEWSMYVSFADTQRAGCYAALEWESASGRPLFGLTMEHPWTHYTVDRLNVFLDTPTINASKEALLALHRQAGKPEEYVEGLSDYLDIIAPLGARFLPLVAYLCSENADVVRRGRSAGDVSIRRPNRARSSTPVLWEVGWRIGPAIRVARDRHEPGAGGTRGSPRAHVRRAHFHHFWTGPRDGQRRLVLRWLHPVLVKTDDLGHLGTVVRLTDEALKRR